MGGRSFAGYSYRQNLGLGFYGESHRLVDATGKTARGLHVTPRLVAADGFAEALGRFGSDLVTLAGPGIVATRTVGRDPASGDLVIVTDDIGREASVEAIDNSARGQTLPYPLALRLGQQLCQALAVAHGQGIVHGGVHPRSVLVDEDGRVFLDHFAVARSLASVAARLDDSDLFAGFRGFLAPELALAEEPTPACDVFAAGSILFTFFGGDLTGSGAQSGRLKATTSVRRVVVRATDTDASRRFGNAIDLADALTAAIESDSCALASAAELAAYADDARGEAPALADPPVAMDGAGLDSLLDELDEPTGLSDPAIAIGVPEPHSPELIEDEPLTAPIDDDGPDDDEPTNIAPPRPDSARPPVDDVLASLESDSTKTGQTPLIDEPDTRVEHPVPSEVTGEHSQLTQVDDALEPERDPISELIELDKSPAPRVQRPSADEEDLTPLPPPQVHDSGSFTKQGHEVVISQRAIKSVQQRAEDAIADLEIEDHKPAAIDSTDFVARRRGLPGWFWAVLTLGALAVMFLLVWTQTDVFHPERARRKERDREAKRLAEEARLKAQQKEGGSMVIMASEDGAAVWLRIGRSPVTSMPLARYHPHQMRAELPGYQADDFVITAADWDENEAAITRKLSAAQANYQPPAWPPKLSDGDRRGFPSVHENGPIRIETQPPQAEIWLLVGFTNTTRLTDFEAGQKYEFKLTKKGFRTGFTVVEESDWQASKTDPTLLVDEVSKRVTLVPEGAP